MADEARADSRNRWRERYQATGIWQAEVARRVPERGMAITNATGAAQLHAWHVPTGALRQLTHRSEGFFDGYISPDGSHVYYLRDEAGSETGHYMRVPWDGGVEQDITPDMPPYAALYRCAVSDDGSTFAFTPTEAEGFPLYCLRLSPDGTLGRPRELYRSPKLIEDAALSYDGEMAVVATTEYARARQYTLLAVSTRGGERVGELSDLPEGSVRAVMFSPLPDDRRVLCTTDRSGYGRPLIWDPRNSERIELALGDLPGDVEPVDWSLNGRRVLLRQVYRAAQQLYTYDLQVGTLVRLRHPGGTYEGARFSADGRIFALWADSTHLPQLVALDGEMGEWRETLLPAGDAPPARLFRSVSFRSSDGVEIQGWLGLPEGEGPFPTILAMHGGPHMVMPEFYNPDAQAWIDHGYAYLELNYRGSTTFGREFKEKVWGNLGHWEVEDMVAAREWLVREGIARPYAVLLTGASYGGYLTLMALGKRPDLWAGGMALVASADLVTEFNDGTDWSRGYLTAMMGGTPEEKSEQYASSSPITYVERMTAPLLVIQGRNDLRCPPRQMERYEEKMRALGKPFEIEWFDAGHGALEIEQFIAFQERMLDFAGRVLGERGGSTLSQ